jgi:hypothetical protein
MHFKSEAQRRAVFHNLKTGGKLRVKHASDYGDNPHIRRGHGESTQTSQEPWEIRYQKEKEKK